jgi:hypothetical protein
MTRIPTFGLLRSALVIVLLVFGLVPLMSAPVAAGHGGGSGQAKAPPAAKQQPSNTRGQQEIQVPQPVQVPQPASPSRTQGMQTIKFAPDPRCATLTEAQRRQTPGCGYN